MAKRLRSITFMAIWFWALALSMPVQVMHLYGHSPLEVMAILHKLTWLNLLVFGGLIANAILLWQVSPWLRISVPALIVLTAANNYFVGHFATDFSLLTTTGATLVFAATTLPLLDQRVKWILRHPDRRWWRRAERHRVHVPLTMDGIRLATLRSETFDVSESGLFIAGQPGLSVGDWINLKITFDAVSQVRTKARVVRRTEARGNYPAGLGIEFIDLSSNQRHALRKNLNKLKVMIQAPISI